MHNGNKCRQTSHTPKKLNAIEKRVEFAKFFFAMHIFGGGEHSSGPIALYAIDILIADCRGDNAHAKIRKYECMQCESE